MEEQSIQQAAAILVAGGPGTRLGREIPKAFVPLNGTPLFVYALRALAAARSISEIILVVPRGSTTTAQAAIPGALAGRVRVASGGRERQDSVRAGLRELEDAAYIAVHDAARPFIATQTIDRVVRAAVSHGAAIAAIRATDTIKYVGDDDRIEATPERQRVWLAQTPQVFRADLLRRAHEAPGSTATDDAVLVERLGAPVHVVQGTAANRKITTAEDLRWAVWMLNSESSLAALR
jgi:2-C-methyl-D-erythritol 4-phosphate cytidylyltransferase